MAFGAQWVEVAMSNYLAIVDGLLPEIVIKHYGRRVASCSIPVTTKGE